jgi:hypothetical protein
VAAFLLAGCTQSVSGVVQDAATGKPVGSAAVELINSGWGTRDGQPVWDAEKLTRTTTDSQGRFEFAEDGGISLRVRAESHGTMATSLCSRSPMLVRIGGPYADLRVDRRLFLDPGPRSARSRQTASAAQLGISASPAGGEDSLLRISAKGGTKFVEGTGAIPPTPPLPYDHATDLDLRSACGWLFVSDGNAPIAVIRIAGMAWEQEPGGPRRRVVLYAPLPRP